MRSNCPLNVGLEVFGDKWSLLIIRDLMFFGKRYYGEFLESDESISTNILADRLALLENAGLIKKGKDLEHKQKIRYRLTQKSIDLLPVILNIGLWSDRYYAEILHPDRDQVFGPVKKNYRRGLTSIRRAIVKEHLRR